MDVENLHQTVFDLSSFEGGGELDKGSKAGLPSSSEKFSRQGWVNRT